jgi:hypothetical protein
LYGLVGAEVIEEVWKNRCGKQEQSEQARPQSKQLAGAV